MLRTATACLLGAAVAHAASPWDPKYTAMAAAVLAKMNASEKFLIVHGSGGACACCPAFSPAARASLGWPAADCAPLAARGLPHPSPPQTWATRPPSCCPTAP